MTWREEILGDGQVREVARSMTRWFAYVDWPDVPRYEAAGWMHPATQVSYPRLHEHGTTMEWWGEGEPPPVPEENSLS